jgi:tRNA (mo5U34)-methyltransferase
MAIAGRKRSAPSLEQVRREVHALGWWFQDFELPPGVRTGFGSPASYDPEPRWRLIEPYVPRDLSGMSVLDLGGNSGFFSIQMLRRGARRCVLVEPVVEFAEQARYTARRFGVRLKVVVEDVHTYCLTHAERFDYVVFLGLLYHLRYPNLVLDRAAEMTKRRLLLQSALLGHEPEEYAHYHEQYEVADAHLLSDPAFPKLTFLERVFVEPTNWWLPNAAGLSALVRAAGMEIVARPDPEIVIAEPQRQLGTARYRRLVFPRYGRPGFASLPGRIRFKPHEWQQLLDTRTEPLEPPADG